MKAAILKKKSAIFDQNGSRKYYTYIFFSSF